MLKHLVLILLAATTLVCAAEAQPDPAAMQAAMMKAGTPGPEHQQLAKLAGEWEVAGKCWMDPSQPPVESKGSSTFSVIFGGRYVMQEFQGDMMGQKFEGKGAIGYDNTTKKYQTGWIDSMTTAMIQLEGASTDGGKTVEYKGDMICPIQGPSGIRQVISHAGDDAFTFTMYLSPQGRGEMKMMELSYTRKKQ